MTQNELARRMQEEGFPNWHQNTVSRLEKGERQRINFGELGALSEILQASVVRGTPTEDRFRELGSKALPDSAKDQFKVIGHSVLVIQLKMALDGARDSLHKALEELDRVETRLHHLAPEFGATSDDFTDYET